MKKIILFTTMCCCFAFHSYAQYSGTCGENLTWTLNEGTLTISGTGAMTDWSDYAPAPWYEYSSLIITAIVENGVTSLGSYAFRACPVLVSVTIGNSLTSFPSTALSNCSALTSINVDENNPVISSIDGILYSKSQNILRCCPAGKVGQIIIPNSVTQIDPSAFSNCRALTSIIIPNSVTRIYERAFFNCSAVSIIIPNSVTAIGEYAFAYCDSLTSVTISNSVGTISQYTFLHCRALSSVTIPNSVGIIRNFAFSDCSALSSVTIPNSVRRVLSGAFAACTGLTSVTIGSAVTHIESLVFSDCGSLTSVTCNATTPPSLTYNGSAVSVGDVFSNVSNINFYIPCATVEDYTSAWGNLNYIESEATLPADLSVSNFNEFLRLSWTGNGSSFDIYKDGVFLENVHNNIYIDSNTVVGQEYCYKIKAYSGSCESDFSEEVCEVKVSVKDKIDNKLSIYPNPAKDELRITNYELRDGEMIQIYNTSGQLVETRRAVSSINISNLPQGTYIVKVGNKTAKIVKN